MGVAHAVCGWFACTKSPPAEKRSCGLELMCDVASSTVDVRHRQLPAAGVLQTLCWLPPDWFHPWQHFGHSVDQAFG